MLKNRLVAILLCIIMLIGCGMTPVFGSGNIELFTPEYTARYPGNMSFYGGGTQAGMNATNWIEFAHDIKSGRYRVYVYAASVSDISLSIYTDAPTKDQTDFVTSNIAPDCAGVFENTGSYSGSTAEYKYIGDMALSADKQRICIKAGVGGITFMGIRLEPVAFEIGSHIRLEGELLENLDYPSRLTRYNRLSASKSAVAGISGALAGAWNISVGTGGYYTIAAYGAAKDANIVNLTLDGARRICYDRPLFVTGSDEINDGASQAVLNDMVYLSEGNHTIEFIKSSTGGCTLDYIDLIYTKALEKDIVIRAFEFSQSDNASVQYYPKLSFTGGSITYDFDVPKNGCYDIFVNASNAAENTNGTRLLIDIDKEKTIESVRIPSTDGWNSYADTKVLTAYLASGAHKIRLCRVGDDLSMMNIRFAYTAEARQYNAKDYVRCTGGNVSLSDKGVIIGKESSLTYNVPAEAAGYYRINFEVSNPKRYDTGVSVTANSESVNEYIKPDEEAASHTETVLLPLVQGNNIISFDSRDNEIEIYNFSVEKADEVTEAFEAHILEELKQYGAEAVLKSCGKSLGIDIDEDTRYIFDKTGIYDALDNASSLIELEGMFADKLIYQIRNSSLKLFDEQGNRVYRLEEGLITAVYSLEGYSEAVDVAAAVYKDGVLVWLDIDMAAVNSSEFLINGAANNDLKVFVWNSVESLKPYEEASQDIYVSPEGTDVNPGTQQNPVRTIERAVSLAGKRSQLVDADITVHLADGEYRINKPVQIDNTVKQNDKKLIFQGSTDTVISGGKRINSPWTAYEELSDGRVIYKTEIGDTSELRQLWVNGERADRAKSAVGNVISFYPETAKTIAESSGVKISIPASSGIAVSDNTDMEMVFNLTWANQRIPIQSVNFEGNENGNNIFIVLPESEAWARLGACAYNRLEVTEKRLSGDAAYANSYDNVYIENSLHLLDSEGEFWYRQPEHTINGKGVLYYLPRSGQDLGAADIEIGLSDGLLDITGGSANDKISGIFFRNIAFRYGTWLEPNRNGIQVNQADSLRDLEQTTLNEGKNCIDSQINIAWAENIEFHNCEFSHLGSAGIGLKDGAANVTIYGNKFLDLSGGSMIVGDWKHYGDNEDKICRNIVIENNDIQKASAEYYSCPALSVYYVKDVDILHNTINDAPYSGISIGWGWGSTDVTENVRVIGNRVEDTVNVLNDGAPLYLLGQMHGSIVKDNYFDKSSDTMLSFPKKGIYLDQGAAYVTIENNVVKNCNYFLYANVMNHDNTYGTTYSDTFFSVVREYNADTENYTRLYPPRRSAAASEALEIINNAGVYK